MFSPVQWWQGELQLTTTPQRSPAVATPCPHSALSWVTFLEVSTAMFQPWCSVNSGLRPRCVPRWGPQPGASCSQRCVHSSVPALAFKPCSSNGPSSQSDAHVSMSSSTAGLLSARMQVFNVLGLGRHLPVDRREGCATSPGLIVVLFVWCDGPCTSRRFHWNWMNCAEGWDV